MTRKTRNVTRLLVAGLLITAWLLYLRWNSDRARNAPLVQKASCLRNLNQIGLSFRQWALDNDDKFPFSVGTNAGGTMEFCARKSDGFDSNVALHFQVLSNELTKPKLLVCPQDTSRKPSADFVHLHAENVTYRLRTGTNVSKAHLKDILLVCPIDGNTLYCDGTVVGHETADDKKPDGRMHVPPP